MKGTLNTLMGTFKNERHVTPDRRKGPTPKRYRQVKESICYFRKCLSIAPHYLAALWNLENASNLAVERWHFRMLNDEYRNDAFKEAIFKKIKKGFNEVLDIGTGTGILSLMAVKGKAKKVYACDSSPIMVEIAERVFEANGVKKDVELFLKHSEDLKIPEDIPDKVSLVVSEILDNGLLGENVLQTLVHAWDRFLLSPGKNGVVIPEGATLFIAGIESDFISKQYYVRENQNLFELNVIQKEVGYDCHDLRLVPRGFQYLTNVEKVSDFDFNDPETMKEILKGNRDLNLSMKCTKSGRLDCFALWFRLRLDEDIVLNTGPDSSFVTCWDQAVFPLKKFMFVQENQEIRNRISFLNGELTVKNLNGENIKDDVEFVPSEQVIRMFNDENLMNVFKDIRTELNSRFTENVLVLDIFPFPIFGLNFLLQRKDVFRDVLTSVVTNESEADYVRFIAKQNNLEERVKCILEDNLEEVFNETHKYDIIMMNLISATGELKRSTASRLSSIRKCLKPNGILLPEKVSVKAQFVESHWLERMSRVLNDKVTSGYKISQFINAYQVEHNIDLDLSAISKTERSDQFDLLTIGEEKNFRLKVPISRPGLVNALVYWFSIEFLPEFHLFSTLNENSNFKQAAILIPKRKVSDCLNIQVFYEEGIFHVEWQNN